MKQRTKSIIDRLFDVLFVLITAAALVGFVASLFWSCNTTRKATISEAVKVEDHTQVDTRRDSTATTTEYRKDSLRQQIAENYEVKIRRVEYDTTKPPDGTGRPPIWSEELITVKAKKETQTDAGSDTQKADSVATSARDSTRNDIRKERESKSRTVEKKRPPWTLIIIGIGTAAVGVWFFIRRIRR